MQVTLVRKDDARFALALTAIEHLAQLDALGFEFF
jgi:hypothetical protein